MAILTGSKNALKGAGFFLGGLLLSGLGYVGSLVAMASALALVLLGSTLSLPRELGKAKAKRKFEALLSKSRDVNVLSAARFFLFGARDVWFVVGVPVFLSASLGWTIAQVGSFLALWTVGYGLVQSIAPRLVGRLTFGHAPQGRTAQRLAFALTATTLGVTTAVQEGLPPAAVLVGGLGLFGFVFAVNSSVHSYLILAYSDGDEVAMNVGFYYMANAGGRLTGTLLSGVLFQVAGITGCLWGSVALSAATGVASLLLPHDGRVRSTRGMRVEGSD